MATYTATIAKSATLTANTVDVVTLDKSYRSVEILNRGTDWIWVTVDTGLTNSTTLTPTVAGDSCYPIGPGAVRIIPGGGYYNGSGTTVRLISATATAYTVTGLN